MELLKIEKFESIDSAEEELEMGECDASLDDPHTYNATAADHDYVAYGDDFGSLAALSLAAAAAAGTAPGSVAAKAARAKEARERDAVAFRAANAAFAASRAKNAAAMAGVDDRQRPSTSKTKGTKFKAAIKASKFKAAKSEATKAKAPRTKPTHPPSEEMVRVAILRLAERRGSSLIAIKKFIAANYRPDVEKIDTFIKKALMCGVKNGSLLQRSGKGASGSFKLMPATAKMTTAALRKSPWTGSVQSIAALKKSPSAAKAKTSASMPRAKADKPRGRMSSYAYFVQTCREEHRKKHPNEAIAFAAFSKKCSERWKVMSDKEKKRFIDMADMDKTRYEAEMRTYVPPPGSGKKGKGKRKTKDPNAPKRALSAFFWFCNDERPALRAARPDSTVGDIAKVLGKKWGEVDETEKGRYEAMADKDKARYAREMAAYKSGVAAAAAAVEEDDEMDDEEEEDDDE